MAKANEINMTKIDQTVNLGAATLRQLVMNQTGSLELYMEAPGGGEVRVYLDKNAAANLDADFTEPTPA